jgi:hypothetical protein
MAVGFFIGRRTAVTKEVVRYVQGDTVSGTLDTAGMPVKETIPEIPDLPLKRDTVWLDNIIYVATTVDTAAIINDYIASREYIPVLFDNPHIGQLSLSATVQYNRLQDLSYTFIPVYKEITRHRVPVLQPYVGASYNTLQHASFSAGTFYGKIGVELQYVFDVKNIEKGYGVGLKYKF